MVEASAEADLMALASTIAPQMALIEINLMASQLRREGYVPAEDEVNLHSEFSFKPEYKYFNDKKQLLVIVHFISRGSVIVDEQPNKVYRVEASFAASYVYQGSEEPPENVVGAFANLNGIYNCWPYWREYLQSSTVRMALPPVVLPLITGATIQEMLSKRTVKESAEESVQPIEADDS